jgi:hypothetical protein
MLRPRFRLTASFHPTVSHCCAVFVACGLMFTVASPAVAQLGQGGQPGGGQAGGGIGSGGIGSGGIGGGGTGGGGTGGGGTGGGRGGGGGGGTNTGGPGSLAGSLAGPELMTFGQTVDVTGGTGFAGRGNAAQNFVGGIVQGQGQTPLNGRGRTNQFQSLNRQGQFRQGFQQPTGPSRSALTRPRHRIAFSYAPQQTQTVAATLQTRLTPFAIVPGSPTPGGTANSGGAANPTGSVSAAVTANPGNSPNSAGVSVTLNDQGVATLRGTVGSDHASRLAAAMARLEPGVRSVDNQLSVAGEGMTAGP